MKFFMSCMRKAQEDGGFSTIFKIAAVIVGLWVVSPVDPVPDWFLVVGWLDDLAVMIGLYYAIPQDFFDSFKESLQEKGEAASEADIDVEVEEPQPEVVVEEEEVIEAVFEEN
jgi:uncharacterized membrane protein YkvA (DUF1232 family)